MFIKAIAFAVFASTIFSSAADAANWRCGRLAGFNVCAVDRSYVDSLKIEWSNGDYTWIKTTCDQYSFNTTHGAQYITYNQAQRIVADWCEG